MEQSELRGIPPWLMSFFIHVVKRCAGVLVAWIDEAAQANGKGCAERRVPGRPESGLIDGDGRRRLR